MLRTTPAGLKWGITLLVAGLMSGCVNQPAPITPAVGATPLASIQEDTESGVRLVQVSVDQGAGMVVVNRQAVGLAPQEVALPVTEHGYLRSPISVGVRFVARDVEEASVSVEEVLEVTDRAPTQLVFSRDKPVRRVFAIEAN